MISDIKGKYVKLRLFLNFSTICPKFLQDHSQVVLLVPLSLALIC